MNLLRLPVLLGLVLVLAAVPKGVFAQSPADVPAADTQAVRTVIEAQLAAFAADDAARAFSFAAPGIREMFGTAENFVEMVRRSYPMVYRPASRSFLTPLLQGDEVVQELRIVDAQGRAWIAEYRLQRQADRSWRITSCRVGEATGRFT